MVICYCIAIAAAIFTLAILTPVKLLRARRAALVFRILAGVLAAAYYVRYDLGADVIAGIYYPDLPACFSARAQLQCGLAQVWLGFAAELLIILYPFFGDKVPAMRTLVATFGLVVSIANFSTLSNHILVITGTTALSVRSGLMAAETGFMLAMSAVALWDFLRARRRIGPKEALLTGLALVGILLCTAPDYTLQLLLNPRNIAMKVIDLTFWHRVFIYPAFVIPVVLYLLLKDRSKACILLVLLFYAFSELNHFTLTHKFDMFSSVTRASSWPLHLCNTALYITPFCLVFSRKRLFYFTYFINVLGAFFALTMPNYSLDGIGGSVLLSSTLGFYRSHYQAFFMPLLTVGLGVFERPRLRQFIWSMVGFCGYFVLVLVLNSLLTNFDAGVDYFFVNSDFIADKLGTWAENTRKFVWSFSIGSLRFTFYPLYQSLFFLVYIVLALGMWFLYELAFDVVHGWQDIARRRRKVKADALALAVALGGRSSESPMNPELSDALVLDKFTKRYGHSDVYAVKDACLTVRGGEIFGFLGPNGAGKSTIIKSIVGIQPITAGGISVCGYDVARQSVQAKRQIGFVPDHYALYERLTAREYVNYIADLYDVPLDVRTERLNRMVERFELQKAVDDPIKTYSHGMKQKVTIMAALIHDPKLWILDEPLTGLDPNSIYQVKECMKEHAAKGNIVFFSSHIIDVVERICDRIAIIRKGQIQCVRSLREMEENGESLEQFYLSVIENGVAEAIPVEKSGDDDEPSDSDRRAAKKRKRGAKA